MSFLFRKSQEQNKYPAINPFEEDNIRESYLTQDEQPSLRAEKSSRTIRIGEVQAIFGNKNLQENKEERIQDMGFLKKREHARLSSDEESWSDRQSPLNFMIISGVLILSIVVGWCVYHWMSLSYDQQPPVIPADNTPFKHRPENPGGLVIPHQDKLVYGRIMPEQQQAVEHLLPQPEQPMELPAQLDAHETYLSDSYPQEQYPAYSDNPYEAQQAPQDAMNPQAAYPQTAYAQERTPPSEQGYDSNAYERNPRNLPAHPPLNAPITHQGRTLRPQDTQRPVTAVNPHAVGSIQQPRGHANTTYSQHQPYTAPAHPNAAYQTPPQQQAPYVQQSDDDIPAYESSPLERARQHRQPLEHNTVSKGNNIYEPFSPPAYNDGVPDTKTLDNTAGEREKTPLDALIEEEMSGKPNLKGDEDLTEKKSNKGAYRIQVATFASESEAENEVKRLRHLDASLMKNVKFIVQKYKKGKANKIMYRVMLGFFQDAKTANQFKNKLKIHRVSGIIVKN